MGDRRFETRAPPATMSIRVRGGPKTGPERSTGGRFDGADGTVGRLVAAFPASGRPQEVADASAVQTARCDDAVVDANPTAPPPNRDTGEDTPACEPRQPITVRAAGRTMQFRRVEVRQPDLDPGRGIAAWADAQAVAVADITDDAAEGLPGAVRQRALAGVGHGDRRGEQLCAREKKETYHQGRVKGDSRLAKPAMKRKKKQGRLRALRQGAQTRRSP